MALRGTIDTFALTDVLALLAASSKTGRLTVQGDRGTAELVVDTGQVVGGAPLDPAGGPTALLFELLRFSDASFDFDAADELAPEEHGFAPVALTDGLELASAQLEEWRTIEQLVPSPRHTVHLADQLPLDAITLSAEQWPAVVAAGAGVPVAALPELLGLDEFSAGTLIAALVRDGVLIVVDPPVEDHPNTPDRSREVTADSVQTDAGDPETGLDADADADADASAPAPGDGSGAPEVTDTQFPDRFPIDDLLGSDPVEVDDPWNSPEMEQLEAQRLAAAQSFEGVELEALPLDADLDPAVDPSPTSLDDPAGFSSEIDEPLHPTSANATEETTEEVLRQMSRLSPQAAQAIAAALNTTDAQGPDADESGAGTAAEPVSGSADGDDGPISYVGRF